MANHTYPIEVQSDFLEKITRAKPVQALAELIWNSLDADASIIDVTFEENNLGGMSKIIVRDNGTGMRFDKASEHFRSLGGSWKRMRAQTDEGRFLHGQDGRGRFKTFALGRCAEWNVAYDRDGRRFTFTITMSESNIKEIVISDEEETSTEKRRGVILTVSELHKDFRGLTSEDGFQEFTEIFALYLADYKNVGITIDGSRVDPSKVIASQMSESLSDICYEGKVYPVRLDLIEWRSSPHRALYLCNENGFPLTQVQRRFHVGSFQFSAYLKSQYISELQGEGNLELAEMNPVITKAADEAQEAIKTYFRNRQAQEARTVVQEWKQELVYPFEGEAATRIEQVERQVFDIVAVNVAQYLPEFSSSPQKNKALHLRLLRQAIEKSPEDLQLILENVLALPKRKQEELADLLREVSLSAIISAAKIVADRLKFLTGLETILFDDQSKKRLKERSQLHRIIAQNCWLFGEEYHLSVDDRSLTEVLRKHLKLLGKETVVDEPVKHVSKERGIVDLVLSRAIRRHKANDITHLVVELKAPKVKIDSDEIGQIEGYARSVMKDERFKAGNPRWEFWAISDDYGEAAEFRIKGRDGKIDGRIYQADNVSIWVKTWGQILDENRIRLQFFQERLEYEADRGTSLEFLQKTYSQFLQGVLVEEPAPESEE